MIEPKAFSKLALNTSQQNDYLRKIDVQKAYIRGLNFMTS